MELVYSVSRTGSQKKNGIREEKPLCRLSCKNIVAFTSTQDLTGKTSPSSAELHHFVFVCDIDQPWDIYLVTRQESAVVCMEWDTTGSSLLLANKMGHIQIWSIKDFLLNEWECTGKSSVAGEEIISLTWLHTGRVVNFRADKKDSFMYNDKFTYSKFSPSVSHFGGKATQGWIAVTSTSLVCVGLLNKNGVNIDVQKECLGSLRTHICLADIAFSSSAVIHIATSDGLISSLIQCFKVTLKADLAGCAITSTPSASLYAKCHLEASCRDSPTSRITQVCFMCKESPDNLVVCASDGMTSYVETWFCTEQKHNIHRLFATPAKPDSTYHTSKWTNKASLSRSSIIWAVATPRFPVLNNHPTEGASVIPQSIVLAYKDGSVQLINKHNFQIITNTNLDSSVMELDSPEKRRKVMPSITSMQQTYTGCGLVAVDNTGCLHLIKTVNTRDPMTQVSGQNIVNLLEYALVSGYDWWDILLALRPGIVENVIQRLTDIFHKQPSAMQEMMYCRLMSIKSSLYRCSTSGQQRAADCQAKLLLNSIATAFKSVLRPKNLSSQDMSPAEKLDVACSSSSEFDIDKVILTLNPDSFKKEFFVEPVTLQSLQHLIQWVAEFTLHLLASIPLYQGYSSFPGATILRDPMAMGSLRELLVLIRIWGLVNQNCLPKFTRTQANLDYQALLFKLLTKIWATVKDSGSFEHDDALLDECCLLPSQVLIPNMDRAFTGENNQVSCIFTQQQPIQYHFGDLPEQATRVSPVYALPDGQSFSQQKRDSVHQVYLGVSPSEDIKQCSRCACLSMLRTSTRSVAMRSWDHRWAKICPCGGQWKMECAA